MRYGAARMRYNGCEIIAVCNALRTLGAPMPLWETAECFSRTLGLWLFGIFGTRPHAIPSFFRGRGFRVTVYKKRAYEDAAKETVLIYSYWNPRFRGIHTVELHKTEGGYEVLNYRPLARRKFPTPAALCGAIPASGAILLIGIAEGRP